MARTRMIKPDFFVDEDLALLTPMARLLFAGLWLLADRHGRLEDRPLKIRAALFPYESVDVDVLLAELARPKQHASGSFILRYEIEGRHYLQVCNFAKHQHPHPKEPDAGIPPAPRRAAARPESATAGNGEAPAFDQSGQVEDVQSLGGNAAKGNCKPWQAMAVSSVSDTESNTVSDTESVSQSPGKPRTAAAGPGTEPTSSLTPEAREEFAKAVWTAWLERRGRGGPEMSTAEWHLVCKWMDELPLRVVLRGINDCGGKLEPKTPLLYAGPAVLEAAQRWQRGMTA